MSKKPKVKAVLKTLSIHPLPQAPANALNYQPVMESIERMMAAGHMVVAEFQLLQIIEQVPKELQPKLRLLTCYVMLGRGESAEALIDELLKKFPRSVEALNAVAWYYCEIAQAEKAMPLLKKANAMDPRSLPVYFNLGKTYTALGKSEQAIAAFNKAIAINPAFGTGYFFRALVLKGKTADSDLKAMEAQLEKDNGDREERSMLHMAIAWGYDGKDVDKQFHHLDASKVLLSAVFPWSEAVMENMYRGITGFFKQPLLSAEEQQVANSDSPVFIAAMPRSGTTLLEQILGTHSALVPSGESHVIEQALDDLKLKYGYSEKQYWEWLNPHRLKSCLPELREFFSRHARVKNAEGKRIVDKTLENFRHVGVILSMFPNARIIHLRRHPLDVLLSIYQLNVRLNGNNPWSLEELAKQYVNSEQFMDHWKSIYPDNIYTVDYEALVGEPALYAREILSFCDLPWEDECLEFYKQERTINTPSVMQVFQPVNKQAIERWRPYAQYLEGAAKILGISIN